MHTTVSEDRAIKYWGLPVEASVGKRIRPDFWGLTSKLQPSDWEKADYRIPSAKYVNISYAVKVAISGRCVRRFQGENAVRVQITFVGDGEPDKITGGWMFLEQWD